MKYTLEKICTSLVRGPFGSALKKDFFVEPSEDTYKVYEQGNAIRKSKDYGQYYIDTKKYEELKRFEVRPYDFIMSCSGTIGELYQLPEEAERGVINQALLKITLNNDLVDYDYFSYVFRYNIANLEAKGSGIQNVASIKVLKEMEFEIPDLQTQKSIVAVLNKTNSIIKNREQELNALDELIKARFVELFGDIREEQLLGEISEFVTVGIANSATHAYAESGVPMLRNQNIKENYLDDSDLIYIKPEFAAKYDSKKLKENDIIAMRTGYPGVACLVPKKYEGCQTFTTLIVRLKADNNPSYVCSYINSDLGKKFIESEKVGVAQQNVGAKSLAQMPIKIAPKELQDEYADFVKQVDKSKVAVQKSLDETQRLFDSLMQKYFG